MFFTGVSPLYGQVGGELQGKIFQKNLKFDRGQNFLKCPTLAREAPQLIGRSDLAKAKPPFGS